MKRISLVISIALCATSCASMNTRQEKDLRTWESDGVAIEEKNPTTGAWLGVLPGVGSFYTGQIALGVVDLLLWPYSIIWDPVAGYQGAKLRNWEETSIHVEKLEKNRKIAMNKLEDMRDRQEISLAEYKKAKRDIEAAPLKDFEKEYQLEARISRSTASAE